MVIDRATLGWLLLVWEPLFILSLIGLVVFLLGLSAWVFHYGARGMTPWVLLALALVSAYGCAVVPGQIVASLSVLALPEQEPALELGADGAVTQKVSPKGQHSRLQFILCQRVNDFAEDRGLALAFPELRTVFGGAAYVPDVTAYRWARIPRTPEGKVADDFRLPPDVAVEIVSPEQSANALVRRCLWYVANGVEIALLVHPADESVLIFQSQVTPRAIRGTDQIDLDRVLPGFELTAVELFDALRLS